MPDGTTIRLLTPDDLEAYLAHLTRTAAESGRDGDLHHGPYPRDEPFDVDAQIAGPAMCGSPAQIVDQIGALRETLGMDLHVPMFDHGTLPDGLLRESMELFGSEVLPKVR